MTCVVHWRTTNSKAKLKCDIELISVRIKIHFSEYRIPIHDLIVDCCVAHVYVCVCAAAYNIVIVAKYDVSLFRCRKFVFLFLFVSLSGFFGSVETVIDSNSTAGMYIIRMETSVAHARNSSRKSFMWKHRNNLVAKVNQL